MQNPYSKIVWILWRKLKQTQLSVLENGIQQKSIRHLIDTFEPKYYFISCSTLDGENISSIGTYS